MHTRVHAVTIARVYNIVIMKRLMIVLTMIRRFILSNKTKHPPRGQ